MTGFYEDFASISRPSLKNVARRRGVELFFVPFTLGRPSQVVAPDLAAVAEEILGFDDPAPER